MGISLDWKRFLKFQFDDLYPALQPFTPVIVGLEGGEVSTDLVRMGRLWNVNITVSGASTATAAYVDLPFTSFATSLFMAKLDGDSNAKVAYIEKNTSRLFLPDWSASTRVIISGTAGE